jgi:SRSO17 transposase
MTYATTSPLTSPTPAPAATMIDRELYLPRCWTEDPDRLTDAGVPDDIDFATKPALAAGMLARVLRAGVPARWVAGDEFYGNDPDLRIECEAQRIGYVLAIGRNRRVPTAAGPIRADALAAGLPKRAWQRLSAGRAKGHRYYDWAWISLDSAHTTVVDDTGCWWPLVRRNRTTGEMAFYRCYAPHIVPLRELVRVAGRRWTIEESFQTAKGWPVSTNTRSAAGPPGNAGPCSR